jgi:hypothetical protein
MAKYGKEDVYVTASDGSRVLRERLSEYEKTLANMPKSDKSDTTPKFLEDRQKEDKLSNKEEISKVQDDAIVINYIMLARIYDQLTIIADALGKGEDMLKLMDLHKSGQLMSPPPVITTSDNEE